MEATEPRSSHAIEVEIATLRETIQALDLDASRREEELLAIERQLDEALIQETLGANVDTELRHLRERHEKLTSSPDRRRAIRAALGARQAELQKVRRTEAKAEAARLAAEALDRVSRLESELHRVARKLQAELSTFTKIYSAGVGAKIVGPSHTPRALVYDTVRQAFGSFLHPAMERQPVPGEKFYPLRFFLEKIVARTHGDASAKQE